MACTPSAITITTPGTPGTSLPGFGIPSSPVSVPLEGFELPTELVEDLTDLFNKIGAQFPSGLFKANTAYPMKTVLDFVANILDQVAPFISFYNFIMAALNLIICIIEVLCAIPNPFAVAIKLKKLFAECLPPFLNLFPWSALTAMIISLLLLILALIIYIIETIIAIITELIENLTAFGNALTLQDSESALAVAAKIASLLCIIENVLSLLLAIGAIMAVIQALMQFAGSGVCSDDDTSGCCPPEICPSFIKENSEISVTSGQLVYYNQIGPDLSGATGLPASIVSLLGTSILLREERWQLFDTNTSTNIPINLIITSTDPVTYGGQTFYPDQSFTDETPAQRAPYTVDIRLRIDPATFGHSDTGRERFMRINDCIVVNRPHNGLISFNNSVSSSIAGTSNGVFDLEGGLVFEDDGETPFNISGTQATLNTFIHEVPITSTSLPTTDDGYTFSNVEFVWKPNHPALASYDLITVGCIPSVSLEKATQNAIIIAEGIDAVIDRLSNAPEGTLVPSIGVLPNVNGAQECVQGAINTLRSNINAETAAEFRATAETCLNDLKNQTLSVLCEALSSAVSQFKSTFALDTDVQFTTRPIIVSVTLKDAAGTIISNNVPDECAEKIIESLEAEASLGTVDEFAYDIDTGTFKANLTSDVSGEGTLKILFDNKVLSKLVTSVDFDTASSIEETEVLYTFVDAFKEPDVRRNESDVAGV